MAQVMLCGDHFHPLCRISCRKKQLILRHAYLCIKWSTRECWRPSLAASAPGRNLLSFMLMEGGELAKYSTIMATKLSSISPVRGFTQNQLLWHVKQINLRSVPVECLDNMRM